MLSPDDVALVARDPGLPGLATLLDRDAFLAALRRKLPDAQLLGARVSYVRYKPAVNCLVGYEVVTPAGPVDVLAKGFPAGETGKIAKRLRRPAVPGPLGPGVFALDGGVNVVVSVFPNDERLEALPMLGDPERRLRLLKELFRRRPQMWAAETRKLAYKAMRRYVAQVLVGGEPRAVIRFYTEDGYAAAEKTAKALRSRRVLRVAKVLGRQHNRHVLAAEWLPGRPLARDLATLAAPEFVDPGLSGNAPPPDPVAREAEEAVAIRSIYLTGVALGELHAQRGTGLAELTRDAYAQRLMAAADAVAAVCPHLADRAKTLATRIAGRIRPRRVLRPVHGDFYADQVVLDGEGDATRVSLLDLDEAGLGDPAADLGNFLAHVENHTLRGRLRPDKTAPIRTALLDGYRAKRRRLPPGVEVYVAAGLLMLAPHTFRRREADWARRTEALLDHAAGIIGPSARVRRRKRQQVLGTVSDPFNVPADPTMGFVTRVLDPQRMQRELGRCLTGLAGVGGEGSKIHLRTLRVTRYKPALRCLIEYDLDIEREPADGSEAPTPTPPERVTVIGKVRAKATDETTFRVTEALWHNGFGPDSPDGISVAPPVGILPEGRIWFQLKKRGIPSTQLIPWPGGVELVRRIAEAAHKLHGVPVPTHRRHTMADELRILRHRLSSMAEKEPHQAARIGRLLDLADRAAASVPEPPPQVRGVHRDFYPDQVLVDASSPVGPTRMPRIYVVDLDLYCYGDPGLDAGNFIAHLTEQALRTRNDPYALAEHERVMEERFVELSGESVRPAVRAYAALTLARHVQISTQMAERRVLTGPLMDLAEERLSRVAGVAALRAAP